MILFTLGGGGTQVYCRKQEKDERELCFFGIQNSDFQENLYIFPKIEYLFNT